MIAKRIFRVLILITIIIFSSIIVRSYAFALTDRRKVNELSLELLWFKDFKINGAPGDWPMLVDINGDSKLEIIAEGGTEDYFDSIYIFDHNGTVLANFVDLFRYAWNPYPFIVDYDSDGRLEYFLAVDNKIYVIDTQLKKVDNVIYYSNERITGVLYGDWDNDGNPELLIDYWRKGLFLYDFSDRTFHLLINESFVGGRKVYVWGYLRPLGKDRIVFLNFVAKYCTLGVVDLHERRVLWAVNVSTIGMSSTFSDIFLVGDFDGDGVKEIVIPGWYPELYVFSSDDGHLEAYFNFTGDLGFLEDGESYFATADLDGDGTIEGVFAFTPLFADWFDKPVGLFVIIDMKSYVVKRVITYSPEDYGVSGIAPFSVNIFDVDLDGVYDIFVMNGANFTIYDGATLEPKFTYNISTFFKDYYREGFIRIWGWGLNDVVVGDIDGDGYLEIINRCLGWTLSVFRLIVNSSLTPFVYWVPPFGYLNTFGVFENFDRDHDRVADWIEVKLGFNPNSKDSDGDGISDFEEILSIYRGETPSVVSWQVVIFVSILVIFIIFVYIIKKKQIKIFRSFR